MQENNSQQVIRGILLSISVILLICGCTTPSVQRNVAGESSRLHVLSGNPKIKLISNDQFLWMGNWYLSETNKWTYIGIDPKDAPMVQIENQTWDSLLDHLAPSSVHSSY